MDCTLVFTTHNLHWAQLRQKTAIDYRGGGGDIDGRVVNQILDARKAVCLAACTKKTTTTYE